MRTQLLAFTAVLCLTVMAGNSTYADLFFFDNGGGDQLYSNSLNWAPDGTPDGNDLAVHNNPGLPAILINSGTWEVDSLRMSDGGSVNQTGGTLSIVNGIGPDNGLWVGEFGPAASTYTISGGTININDPADGFMVGRGGGSNGVFNFSGGTVNNLVGDTHIGLDGNSTWNQSGGVFNAGGVHIGRFQSPFATATLSGNATWNAGLVLLSDGFLGSAVQSDLIIEGPDVDANFTGIVMKSIANVTFDGAGGGISNIDVGGGIFLLENGELFLQNLPDAAFIGETINLFDNIGSFTGPDSQFDNAMQGTQFGDWIIDYTTQGQINLVAVNAAIPEPAATLILALAGLAAVSRRKK